MKSTSSSDSDDTSENPKINCNKCYLEFCDKSALKKHVQEFHEMLVKYICNLCDFKAFRRDRVRGHQEKDHQGEECKIKRIGCKKCEFDAPHTCLEKKRLRSIKLKCKDKNCSFTSTNKDSLRRHINSFHPNLLKYACNLCDFKTYSILPLQRHKTATHNESQKYEHNCKECGKLFMTKRSLSHHVESIHKAILKFMCNLCDYKSYKKYSVEDHQKWVHENDEKKKVLRIGCNDCEDKNDNSCVRIKTTKNPSFQLGKDFTIEPILIEQDVEMNAEQDFKDEDIKEGDRCGEEMKLSYKCNTCQMTLGTKQILFSHIEMTHQNKFNFQCNLCDYQSYFKPGVERHQKSKHMTENVEIIKVSCEDCGKGVEHEKCPRIKKSKIQCGRGKSACEKSSEYKCSLCDYKSDKHQNVRIHLKSLKHKGKSGNVLSSDCHDCGKNIAHCCSRVPKPKAKNSKCDLCDYVADSNGAKVIHYKDVHPNHKLYNCDQCNYGSNYAQALKTHIDAQHEKKQHVCDLCGFITNWYTLFNSHMRDMHGVFKNVKYTKDEEPADYNCERCDYKSKYKSNLLSHKKAAHGGVKFICDQCEFSTKSNQYLKIHVDVKHNGIVFQCDLCPHQATSQWNLNRHKQVKHNAGSKL